MSVILGTVFGILLIILIVILTIFLIRYLRPRYAASDASSRTSDKPSEKDSDEMSSRLPRPGRLHWYPAFGPLKSSAYAAQTPPQDAGQARPVRPIDGRQLRTQAVGPYREPQYGGAHQYGAVPAAGLQNIPNLVRIANPSPW